MTTQPDAGDIGEYLNKLIDSLDFSIGSDDWVTLSLDDARLCRSLAADRLRATIPTPEEGTEPAGRLEQPGASRSVQGSGQSVNTPQGGAGAAVSSSTQPSADAAGEWVLVPRDTFRPIDWQDVRLAAGEGKLSLTQTLAACNAELRRRQSFASPSPTWGDEQVERLCERVGVEMYGTWHNLTLGTQNTITETVRYALSALQEG